MLYKEANFWHRQQLQVNYITRSEIITHLDFD